MSTYIRPDQAVALASWSVRLGKPKSVIIRAALDQHFQQLTDLEREASQCAETDGSISA